MPVFEGFCRPTNGSGARAALPSQILAIGFQRLAVLKARKPAPTRRMRLNKSPIARNEAFGGPALVRCKRKLGRPPSAGCPWGKFPRPLILLLIPNQAGPRVVAFPGGVEVMV